MKYLFSVVFIISCLLSLEGQELSCQVTINANNKVPLTSVQEDVIKQLRTTVYDFMNTTAWTKDKFSVEERINCQIQLQITGITTEGSFNCMLQVQSSRPGFNSSYNSLLFNFQDDKVSFNFARNALLVYAPNQYRDNLTSVLAFYAYYIIALDYDSFSLKGGTPYFQEAQNIVLTAQSSGSTGWATNEPGNKNNRYWLVDNALHQLFEPLRDCFYDYHRKGIDALYKDKAVARASIYEAMNKLIKVVATRPGYINLVTFVQAKSTEIKNLYSDADVSEKNRIVSLLKRLDPANASKYDAILN
jgi:hypothetical protein